MLYEFRERKSKKHKINKRQKVSNKKLDTKNKKVKQKNIASKQGNKEKEKSLEKGEDFSITWENFNINNDNFEKGIIAGKKGKVFSILNKIEEIFFEAKLDGDIPNHLKGTFVVGDIIYYENKNGEFIIKKRGERNNYLSKTKSNTSRFGDWKEQVIAANINIAVIVAPVKNPKFDYKLIDRYLVLCQNWGVFPIICLNKIDLTNKRDPLLEQYKRSGIPVVETSLLSGKGIEELEKLLLNKIVVILGKSGVGKSTLVNALNSELNLLTQSVNEKSGEGKHTTTSSDLYKRNKNSYIIDTPGIRALGMDQIKKIELKNYFPEFEKYKGMCKYSKCLHSVEPECAVKNAVNNNEINKWRYESYLRILNDLI